MSSNDSKRTTSVPIESTDEKSGVVEGVVDTAEGKAQDSNEPSILGQGSRGKRPITEDTLTTKSENTTAISLPVASQHPESNAESSREQQSLIAESKDSKLKAFQKSSKGSSTPAADEITAAVPEQVMGTADISSKVSDKASKEASVDPVEAATTSVVADSEKQRRDTAEDVQETGNESGTARPIRRKKSIESGPLSGDQTQSTAPESGSVDKVIAEDLEKEEADTAAAVESQSEKLSQAAVLSNDETVSAVSHSTEDIVASSTPLTSADRARDAAAEDNTHVDEEPESTEPRASSLARRRMLLRRNRDTAKYEGNLGGKKVPTYDEAAVAIQSSWRSKLVRKALKRRVFYATEMQRRVRGNLQRGRFKDMCRRVKDHEANEAVRLERLRRIRSRERELVLLRALPADQFLSVDKMRREASARLLQRIWRRQHPKTKPEVEVTAAEVDPVLRGAEALLRHIQTFLPDEKEAAKLERANRSAAAHKIEVDALGLAQLHRRIKDAALSRMREGESAEEQHRSHHAAMELMASRKHKYMARSQLFSGMKPREGGARKKYQDMLRMQEVASVYLDDYQMSRDMLRAAQQERLETLGSCASLVRLLKNPPSLDEASKFIQNGNLEADEGYETTSYGGEVQETERNLFGAKASRLKWLKELPLQGLPEACVAHVRTAKTMEAVAARATGDHSRAKWSVVAAPHDVTGPPVDISTLPTAQYEFLLKGFDYSRINGRDDKEESLWWVSYAAQKSVYQPAAHPHADDQDAPSEGGQEEVRGGWTAVGQPSGSSSQREAQKLLGQVQGEELLQKVVADVMTLPGRKAMLAKMCDDEDLRANRLTQALRDDILSRVGSKERNLELASLDAKVVRQMNAAAMRIQAMERGIQSRARSKVLRAERRVLNALGVLITELALPEIRSGVRHDGTLMKKLQKVVQVSQLEATKPKFVQSASKKEGGSRRAVAFSTPVQADLRADSKDNTSRSSPYSPGLIRKMRGVKSDSSLASDRLEDTLDAKELGEDPDPESSFDPLSYISSPSLRGDDASLDLSASLLSPHSEKYSPQSKHG